MSKHRCALSLPRGLAEAGTMVHFALVTSWTGDRLHPRCSDRGREGGAGDPDLPTPERSRWRMGGGAGTRAPCLDGVQLRRAEAVVRLSRRGMRPEGCDSVW